MSFTKWVAEFKRLTGWTSVRGSTRTLVRQDYDEGMTPREAADAWTGKTKPKPLFTNTQWSNLMSAIG
jgi:hypothetical protein